VVLHVSQLIDLEKIAAEGATAEPEWITSTGPVRLLYYEAQPFEGRPTKVFAYLAVPERGCAPFPAVVLVHGGGGRAFPEWATMWAQRGYVALAMDLAGCGPVGSPHEFAGPGQDDAAKFYGLVGGVEQTWMYHAVADVLHGAGVLATRPEVDPEQIAVVGISWGAHVAELAVALDPRPKAAVFVYGCGFIRDNPTWSPVLDALPSELADRWVTEFDASRYIPRLSIPTLWITGAKDAFYSLDRFQRSHRLLGAPRDLRVTPDFQHSHADGWSPLEICTFLDAHLAAGTPLPSIDQARADGETLVASVRGPLPISVALLHSTTDEVAWSQRSWLSAPAELDGATVRGLVPERTTACLLTVKDIRGVVVSSEYVEFAT
jgi:dienelactone hydrolase